MKPIVSLLAIVLIGFALFIQPVSAFEGNDVSLTPDFLSSCPARTLSEDDISYFITNDGPTTDTFFLSIDWLPGLSFIQPQVTLASGEQIKIEPAWITIPYDVEPGSLFATFKARSSLTGNEVSRTIEIDVLNCHDVELYVSPLERTQQVCTETDIPAVYTMEITNKGIDTETFELSTSVPWASLDIGTIVLNSGEAGTFTLTVDPPESVSDFQTISVTAQSTNSFAADTVDVFADIINCYNFAAIIQPSEDSVCAGRNAEFNILITNTGLDDTFNILTSDNVDLESSSVTINSNDAEQVDFTVSASSVGSNPFEITVQSDSDPGESRTIMGTLTGQECKSVEVIISPAQESVCQGETIEYTVNIENTGSLQDSFDLSATQGSLSQTGVTLDAGESVDISLTVETVDLEGDVTIEVTASNDDVQDTASSSFDSRICYQANLMIVPKSATACPYTDADFDITIENTGEMEDTYEISFGDTMTTVTLESGESETFDLGFPVTVIEESSILIEAVAESDSGQMLTASASLEVKSEEACYSVRLSNGGTETVRINKATAVPLKLKNTGEQPGTFTVSVSGPEYVYVEPSTVQLGFSEEKEVYLYVSPPFGVDPGQVTATVSAISERAGTDLGISIDVLPVNGEAIVTVPSTTGMKGDGGGPNDTTEGETGNDTGGGSISLNISLGDSEDTEMGETPSITGDVTFTTPEIPLASRTIIVSVITVIIIIVLVVRFAFLFKG